MKNFFETIGSLFFGLWVPSVLDFHNKDEPLIRVLQDSLRAM